MSMKRPVSTNNNNSGNNNHYNSYQNPTMNSSATSGYQPPNIQQHYVDSQNRVLENSTQTYYQTEDTANHVLNQMTQQRQQIISSHDNVYHMRITSEQVKRELEELKAKYRAKKNRLYMYIGLLAVTDLLLFIRIIHCHGNFYCF